MDARQAPTTSGAPAGERAGTGITVEAVHEPERLRAIEDLQVAVWDMEPRGVVPATMLYAVLAAGGIVLGAYDGPVLAGFVLGLLGKQNGRLCHVSHMLGIHPRYQGRGLGALLKLRQRDAALAQGLDLMTWTFDPLEARNAHFNLHKLGATSRRYRENLYGEMPDGLNRGLPTDRLVVEWRLRETPGPHIAAPAAPPISILTEVSGLPDLRLPTTPPGVALSVTIPANLQQRKRDDARTALAWRLAVRQALCWAFAQGYQACDFRDGAHILIADSHSPEIRGEGE